MMRLIIDIVLLVIVALCTWGGYRRGLIGGVADTFEAGIRLAAELIDSGKAMRVLEKFIEVSNRPEA